MTLFRKEVFEHRRLALYGKVLIPPHLPYWILTGLLFVVFIFLLFVAVFGTYSRNASASGLLVSTKGTIKLYPHRGGTVSELFVSEGEFVAQGQKLFAIADDVWALDGQSVGSGGLATLEKQIEIAETAIRLEEKAKEAEIALLHQEKASISKTIAALLTSQSTQAQIVESLKKAVTDSEDLRKKGHISRVEYERRVRETLLASQQLEAIKRDIFLRENDLDGARLKEARIEAEFEKKVSELQSEIITLQQQALELRGARQFVVHAPVEGTITSMYVAKGGAVTESNVLASILPQGSSLEAELYVPSSAIAYVKSGQEVKLTYDAFPSNQFGTFSAQIISISRTALLPDEHQTGLAFSEPVFRVNAQLQRDRVAFAGEELLLQPGMQFDAMIVLQEMSLINWILKPFKSISEAT